MKWLDDKINTAIESALVRHGPALAKMMARVKHENDCAHKWRKIDEAVGQYTGTAVIICCDKCGKIEKHTLAI